ncbi:MAG: hypothetical protein AAF465_05810 [Pseudomonadota bacterium]
MDDKKIQGFVINESPSLLLLHYICDFRSDGLMVLRRCDISSIETLEVDRFQTELLKEEGVFESIDFGSSYKVDSWEEFFLSANGQNELFIVEQELIDEPDLAIGKILRIGKNQIDLHYFTGIGRWLDELDRIDYANITSCQLDTNYINVYKRYFERIDA